MSYSDLTSTGLDNTALVEEIYQKYLESPDSVDPSWRKLFAQLGAEVPETIIFKEAPADLRIYHLIQAYRTFGHLMASVNPIATRPIEAPRQLRLESLGFSQDELDQSFPTNGLLQSYSAPLREIIDALKETYCGNIGVEYMGQDPNLEAWLQQHIEPTRFKINLTIEQKKLILQHLNKSELFESFLHTKYVGQKRFSLEGGETLIPILAAIIDAGSTLGMEEFVLGMAHRGRLNVLSNILDKSYSLIFSEFEEGYIPLSFEGSGDVKYHKGFYSTLQTHHGHKVRVVLTPNPSHLEAVDPVVEGKVRAKQVLAGDAGKMQVVPILIHGDAAISGQGVVYETMQMYALEGYSTGGTLHVVINNQIGFTTVPKDGRSTLYCTDIARAFNAPVFHVNAEDPEGCVYATLLAVEMRQKFGCDVFIDLICYRKYGHNESDEPAFTQPIEYQLIRKKMPIREIYRDHLIHQGILERQMAEALEEEFKASLQAALKGTKEPEKTPAKESQKEEPKKQELDPFEPFDSSVPEKTLKEVAAKLSFIPEDFKIHSKLERLVAERKEMGNGKKPIDWGMGETLAYATLLWEGIHVRISGQDVARGTFSHRHALWMDQEAERAYYPLKHLKKDQGRFDVYNSPLSEYAVLGFEFGYSLSYPEALILWEAQFGDFCNGAQVIIDQFMSTGEMKWGQKNSVVLLLPHGYEGQGPEHSSARMERFLALCGDNNMVVANPSSPGQLFHLLRRHVLKPMQKPLIVFTPKGLLRHPECVSTLDDLSQGRFLEVLPDPELPKKSKKLALCSGRIYFDLIAERRKRKTADVAIIRVEQLYPLNTKTLKELVDKVGKVDVCYWVQEEPENMGAWEYIRPYLRKLLPEATPPVYIGRKRSASPAVGSYAIHKKQHAEILTKLFEG